jgi:hypothetical protein
MKKPAAQFHHGEMLTGGNIFINNNASVPLLSGPGVFPDDSKDFEIFMTPQLIHFFRENKAIGLLMGFHSYKSEVLGQKNINTGFDAGIFIKQYKFFYKGLGLYFQLGVNYARSNDKFNGITEYRNSLASLKINPGLFYRFTRHFSMEYVFGEAGIGQSRSRQVPVDITVSRTEFFVGFFDGFNISAYYISSKRKK